jgi:acetolactate synthase-1/2/3 large subunit
MTGAKILLESLRREGVKHMFGYPGGVVIPIFHEFRNYPSIKFYLVRHEQAAAHAADGYARATGKVGVCLATSGPGATNLVTGIATAYMDSVPMVAITGQVRTQLLGTDAFQEADITGITRPITKYNFLVRDVKELAITIREAFLLASTGRPGPVLVDVPVDVSNGTTEFIWPEKVDIRGYKPNVEGHPLQIKRMAEAIMQAQKPVICAGGGVIIAQATQELRKIAEKRHIPVATTLMGMGAFPGTSPLYLGMPGMHGTRSANHAFTECDLLFAVGMRFDDRVTGNLAHFAPHATIVHVDIDPASISKNVKVHVPVVGDAKLILKELDKLLPSSAPLPWNKTVTAWQEHHPLKYKKDQAGDIKPQQVIETLYRLTQGKAVIATEVGQNQMWASQFYKYDFPRTFISSGGLGTMGFGLPAAMGVQVALPGAIVVDIAGDGSLQMNIQELATIAANNIPVKIVLLNNQYLGMVRQWQELFYQKNYAGTCLRKNHLCPAHCAGPSPKRRCPQMTPDFVKLAEAYGVLGLRAVKPAEVDGALKKMLAHKGPVLAEFMVAREENVYPMVPAGKSITEMLEG